MIKQLVTLIAVVLTTLLLTACDGRIHRQDVGMVAGGVAGGFVGNALTGSTLGTVGGTLGGAYLGREVAKRTQ